MANQLRRKNSLRLRGWDYRNAGYYFVTFCTHQRICLFDTAEIVTYLSDTWERIPTWKNMDHLLLDAFVVMPNHIHAILAIIDDSKGQPIRVSKRNKIRSGSIGSAIGAFKSTASRQLRRRFPTIDPELRIWQRGYYDRILRNESELKRTRQYIQMNPTRWETEQNNLMVLIEKMNYHPD